MRIAILAARGGSKGLPGKNICPLGDLPLIAWTIRAARASHVFDRIVLTTDDDEIARIGQDAGAEVPFMRPPELADDTAEMADVVVQAIEALGLGDEIGFALLQPTSPFRSARHIREAAEIWESSPVVSVTAGKPLNWNFLIDNSGSLMRAAPSGDARRRQLGPQVVLPNGGLYMSDVATMRRTRSFFLDGTQGYIMGAIDSIDIDTPEDFSLAEAVCSAGLRVPDAL